METISYIIIALGFASGVVGALLGNGGGIIFVPSLLLLTNYPQKAIVGASLFTVVATSIVATISNIKKKMVQIEFSTRIEMDIIIGTLIGVTIANYFSKEVLLFLLGLLLIIISLQILTKIFKSRLNSTNDDINSQPPEYQSLSAIAKFLLNLIAMTVGLLAGILGIGGGILLVPTLNHTAKFPIKNSVVTSSYLMGVSGSAGALIYLIHGDINPHLTALAILGVLPGSKVGQWIAVRIEPKYLKMLIGILLLCYGVKLCLS